MKEADNNIIEGEFRELDQNEVVKGPVISVSLKPINRIQYDPDEFERTEDEQRYYDLLRKNQRRNWGIID